MKTRTETSVMQQKPRRAKIATKPPGARRGLGQTLPDCASKHSRGPQLCSAGWPVLPAASTPGLSVFIGCLFSLNVSATRK